MATIDVTTLGVLTQAEVGGGLISGGALINWGRSPGETLSTRQRFQHASGYPLPNPQAVVAALPAGTVATLIARSASGGVIDTWEFTVLGSRVLDGGAAFPGASRYRVEIDMDLDIGTSGSWANPPGAAVNNYVIRGATTTSGDVSSHRNFNFNNTVTLDLIRGANQLGTDANGRIIPTADRDVQITTGDAFPTTPERGDFHFLTSTISGTGAADPGIDPVVNSSGATLTYENYVAGAVGIDVPSINIVNIQISDQRNTVTPRLGVAGQTVELFYRSSESDPWEFFGNTTDSAVNGNQFRVRLARMPLAAVNLPNVSVGDQIGYQARPARTVVMDFEAGTYIYDGSAWQLINRISDPMDTGVGSDTFVEGIRFDDSTSEIILDYNTSRSSEAVVLPTLDLYGRTTGISALHEVSTAPVTRINFDTGHFILSEGTAGEVTVVGTAGVGTLQVFDDTSQVGINADQLRFERGLNASQDGSSATDVIVDAVAPTSILPGTSSLAPIPFGVNIIGSGSSTSGRPMPNNPEGGDWFEVLNPLARTGLFSAFSTNGRHFNADTSATTFQLTEDMESVRFTYSSAVVDFSGTAAGWMTNITYRSPVRLHSHTANQPQDNIGTGGAATWNVTHNLDNTNPIVQVYEEVADAMGNITSRNMVVPMSVVPTGNNTLTITFPVAVAGTATVLG